MDIVKSLFTVLSKLNMTNIAQVNKVGIPLIISSFDLNDLISNT